jgi:hypothetical protein
MEILPDVRDELRKLREGVMAMRGWWRYLGVFWMGAACTATLAVLIQPDALTHTLRTPPCQMLWLNHWWVWVALSSLGLVWTVRFLGTPLAEFASRKSEDESITENDHRIKIRDGTLQLTRDKLRVSLRIVNETRRPIVVQGIWLAWQDGFRAIAWLSLLSGACEIKGDEEHFVETFLLTKGLETSARSGSAWVRFATSHHRIAWKYWTKQEPFKYEAEPGATP